MAGIKIQAKSNVSLVRKNQEILRKGTKQIAKSRLKAAAKDLKTRMSTPGKPVKYPINWLHDAQRIKVLIKLRLSGMLPYRRSRKAQQSWSFREIEQGYTVETSLGTRYKYIYGDTQGNHQQPMFTGRWVNFRRQAEIVRNKLPKTVIDAMRKMVKDLPKK